MRTNNRPSYVIVLRRRGGFGEWMSSVMSIGSDSAGIFTSKAEAKRHAILQSSEYLVAEVCELTTVYEVEPWEQTT
jgi:hypothetical protein